jgi:hypothetical protein
VAMQAMVEFFMQHFVDFMQHTPYRCRCIIQRRLYIALLIAIIVTTGSVRATAYDTAAGDLDHTVHSEVFSDEAVDVIDASALSLVTTPAAGVPVCIAGSPGQNDRLWLVSSRHLSNDTRCVNLAGPDLRAASIDRCGGCCPESLPSLLAQLTPGRPVVIHIHGNRMTERDALDRGRFIHRDLAVYLGCQPIDFMIYSWPSERSGFAVRDGRDKAERTEAEGLYFAWLLRELVNRNIPVTVIGYSFGGRIATGALHALAGGSLAGRRLTGQTIRGANIGVGLVAPALEENWLASGQYHGLASQNIRQMALFYNPRDAILRRYPLVDIATRGRALGYAGPQRLAPGFNGVVVPLFWRDCSRFLGIRHNEVEYYTQGCRAGRPIAGLVQAGPGF